MKTWTLLIIVPFLVLGPKAGYGTWSGIIVDPETKEVAIGSATCLTNFDLERGVPVMIVEVGGACAQAMIDGGEINRERISHWMIGGVDPDQIIFMLSEVDFFHEQRQYGIVDMQGRSTTFTGQFTNDWAGGLTGQIGSLVYAIQGNILVDSTVVYEAEQAILNTPGDISEKLMALMEAARDQGGDGRCTQYGKSSHVGFMILSRPGDIDGTCGEGDGCANGDYFMNFNIANQGISDPDPVDQLRKAFDTWRLEMIGRADAVQSMVEFDVASIPPNRQSSATMTISFLDWQGNPIEGSLDSVTVAHAEESDRVTDVHEPIELGGGRYSAEVWGLESEGTDHYIITAYDGIRPVQLTPNPTMTVEVPPGGFEIQPPSPGHAGEINEICITGGIPGSTVYFVYGFERGTRSTPCGPIAIPDAVLLGEATVNGDGEACLSQMVGPGAQGRSARFQAVQFPECDRSNVVVHTFK